MRSQVDFINGSFLTPECRWHGCLPLLPTA